MTQPRKARVITFSIRITSENIFAKVTIIVPGNKRRFFERRVKLRKRNALTYVG